MTVFGEHSISCSVSVYPHIWATCWDECHLRPPCTQHFIWKFVWGFEKKRDEENWVIFLLLSCLIRKYLIKQQNNHHEINNQKHSCHTRANHYSEAAVADSACTVTDPERNWNVMAVVEQRFDPLPRLQRHWACSLGLPQGLTPALAYFW